MCVCVWQSRTSGDGWISHGLNRQSVSYTDLVSIATSTPKRNSFGLGAGRNHLNPLNNVCPYLQPLCLSSQVLHILPVSPHSTNGCQTDLIHFAGDISLPSFLIVCFNFLPRVLILNSSSECSCRQSRNGQLLHLWKGEDYASAVTCFSFYYFFNWKMIQRSVWMGRDIYVRDYPPF